MRKNITKLILTASICFLYAFSTNAQDDVRPFRIGLKIGTPILVGGTIEYVLPIANNKIGITADLSSFTVEGGGTRFNYTYWSLGGNFYLNKRNIGRGPYLGVSYANLGFKGSYSGLVSGTNINGSGEGKVNVSQVQFRLGAKTGKGAFFFQPEIGYGLANFPSSVTFNAIYSNGQTISTTEPFDVPSGTFSFIASITLGFTF